MQKMKIFAMQSQIIQNYLQWNYSVPTDLFSRVMLTEMEKTNGLSL